MRIIWDNDVEEELHKKCSSRRAMQIAHNRAPDGLEHFTTTVFVGWTIMSARNTRLDNGWRRVDPREPPCSRYSTEHKWVRVNRMEERCSHCGLRRVEKLGRNDVTGEDRVWLVSYIPKEE